MSMPLRLLLVGPLPPPSGGMANQTRQLARLLHTEGLDVRVVRTNAPYRPAWIGRLRGLRALFRLVPYLWHLKRGMAHGQVVHLMANSGWAWHLFAAPAIRIAAAYGRPVVVNYRGGLAAEFLAVSGKRVAASVSRCAALVVPSRFLQNVFARHGMTAQVIPNVIDTATFHPAAIHRAERYSGPHIVVTRNLEYLYGNDLAIRAVAALKDHFPDIRLSIAGSGPEREALEALAGSLNVGDAVRFAGCLETAQMVALYQSADVVVNPSRADNTPNSILEALACGVPVVATSVGGVPYLVEHGVTAWLVPSESADDLAEGIAQVLRDPVLRQTLVTNGMQLCKRCSWDIVRAQWLDLYGRLAGPTVAPPPVVRGTA